MSTRNRDLWREVRAEIGPMIRAHASRSAEEREAARERWEALERRSAQPPPSEDFRAELNLVLTNAVARLRALQARLEREDRVEGD